MWIMFWKAIIISAENRKYVSYAFVLSLSLKVRKHHGDANGKDPKFLISRKL
jgi:hypothetical protein